MTFSHMARDNLHYSVSAGNSYTAVVSAGPMLCNWGQGGGLRDMQEKLHRNHLRMIIENVLENCSFSKLSIQTKKVFSLCHRFGKSLSKRYAAMEFGKI